MHILKVNNDFTKFEKIIYTLVLKEKVWYYDN